MDGTWYGHHSVVVDVVMVNLDPLWERVGVGQCPSKITFTFGVRRLDTLSVLWCLFVLLSDSSAFRCLGKLLFPSSILSILSTLLSFGLDVR